jgi:MADS-box transcription factor
MSTNPHAVNRDAPTSQQQQQQQHQNANNNNNIETPISALPSRFMSDNLLPSPSTFYPEWGFGRGSGDMLPSPLNFQTPTVGLNGGGWVREDPGGGGVKRGVSEDEGGGGNGEGKRQRT